MMQTLELGAVTGTTDKDYNLLWFTTMCLKNALRLETYIEDAERAGDREVSALLQRAQDLSIRGSEEGKALLRSRLEMS